MTKLLRLLYQTHANVSIRSSEINGGDFGEPPSYNKYGWLGRQIFQNCENSVGCSVLNLPAFKFLRTYAVRVWMKFPLEGNLLRTECPDFYPGKMWGWPWACSQLPSATEEQSWAAGWLPFLSLTFHGSFMEIHDCMFLKRIITCQIIHSWICRGGSLSRCPADTSPNHIASPESSHQETS